MLEFEFEVVHKSDGRRGRLVASILPPARLAAFPNDYECQIRFSGVDEKAIRAVGVMPFMAVDLAVQMTKANLAAYAEEWNLFCDGLGPLPLNY